MSNINEILIYGAKSNNLKNLDLRIPRDKLVVITGLSGGLGPYTVNWSQIWRL